MEIWLDTVNTKLIEEAQQLGILSGVTTNPLILSQTTKPLDILIPEILDAQPGSLAVQLVSNSFDEMLNEAQVLHEISSRIIIKVPVTAIGLKIIQELSDRGIQTMATVVFDPNQVLLAGLSKADYIAPYVCRIQDAGIDAFKALQTMMTILKNYNLSSKILAASLRETDDITQCAVIGVPAITIKDDLFIKLIETNKNTTYWLQRFSEAIPKTLHNN